MEKEQEYWRTNTESQNHPVVENEQCLCSHKHAKTVCHWHGLYNRVFRKPVKNRKVTLFISTVFVFDTELMLTSISMMKNYLHNNISKAIMSRVQQIYADCSHNNRNGHLWQL